MRDADQSRTLRPSWNDGDVALRAGALDRQRQRRVGAGANALDDRFVRQVPLAVDGQEHVATLEPGLLGGTSRIHLRDLRPQDGTDRRGRPFRSCRSRSA